MADSERDGFYGVAEDPSATVIGDCNGMTETGGKVLW